MGSLVAAMTTLLLLLCSLFPLAACLSLSASTDTQFLHATVDWSTGALKGVQYLPAQARYLSMNAPCFLESRRTGECDDGDDACSILMCREGRHNSPHFGLFHGPHHLQDPLGRQSPITT